MKTWKRQFVTLKTSNDPEEDILDLWDGFCICIYVYCIVLFLLFTILKEKLTSVKQNTPVFHRLLLKVTWKIQ